MKIEIKGCMWTDKDSEGEDTDVCCPFLEFDDMCNYYDVQVKYSLKYHRLVTLKRCKWVKKEGV